MPDTPVPSPEAIAPGTASSGARPSAARNIEDLERRLEAFDQATKRLARTVAPAEPRVPTQMPTSEFISAQTPKDDHSGLRPAATAQAPMTGALTARRAQAVGRPSFTSTIGRPQIAPTSPPPPPIPTTPVADAAAAPRPTTRQSRRRSLLIGGAIVVALVLGLLSLPGMFPVCPEGEVISRTVAVESPANGVLAALTVPVGTAVKAGDVIGHVDHPANVALGEPEKRVDIKAPIDGSVAVRLIAVGRQVTQGDGLLSLALPNTAAVVASLPTAVANRVAIGDRVEVSLIAENRVVDGTIARVLAPGEQIDGSKSPSSVADLRPQLVIELDPSPEPLRAGQGVRVTVLGPRPGALRLLLYRIRCYLPL